jgi:F-type H+-transporting ATPase subunit delta
MEIGRISKRYAKALFLFAKEKKEDEKVYQDMSVIAQSFFHSPELRKALKMPTLSSTEKEKLLMLAAGEKICDTTKDFLKFIIKKGKEEYIHFVSMSYLDLYRKEHNIIYAEVTFSQEVNNELLAKIRTFVEKEFSGKTVMLNTKTDDNIIGGFILDVDNTRLDASVLGELKSLKRTLV